VLEKIDKLVIAKVKKLRIEKGYSQQQLADELDVSPGFIGNVEAYDRYNKKYSVAHLYKIAKILGCKIQDFFPDKPL
jgi:transcriptional regulator with XRE-family HTH domain